MYTQNLSTKNRVKPRSWLRSKHHSGRPGYFQDQPVDNRQSHQEHCPARRGPSHFCWQEYRFRHNLFTGYNLFKITTIEPARNRKMISYRQSGYRQLQIISLATDLHWLSQISEETSRDSSYNFQTKKAISINNPYTTKCDFSSRIWKQ